MRSVKFISALCLSIFLAMALPSFGQAQETENKPAEPKSAVPGTVKEPVQIKELSEASDLAKLNQERYRIGYQDAIAIEVFRHPELSQVVNVNPDGTIRMPRIDQPILAVCQTERELADKIAALYKQNYLRDPFVNVRAVDQKSQSFAVIGAVEKPGSFFVNRRIRLLELLAYAGGQNDEAGTHLIVARTGSNSVCRSDNSEASSADAQIEVLNYKIKDVVEGKVDLMMKPGDIVSVLDAEVIYVTGNVQKPKTIKLKDPITLRQAIADAEGLKSNAKKNNIRILRQKDNGGEPEEIVFNLKEIEEGKVKDPFLQPNDIVAVSEDKTKTILNSIGKSLTQGLGSMLIYAVP